MFGHHDELVQLESALLLVSVESFQEESSVGLDNKKSSALPGCESYEIGAGWGHRASGLHGIPQRLEAALLQPITARLKPCPSRSQLRGGRTVLGRSSTVGNW